MRPPSSVFRAAALAAALACVRPAWAADPIQYDVRPGFNARQVEVTITVPHVTDPAVRFELPVWSPGAYFASDTSGNLVSATADDGGSRKLTVNHPDRQMWEVEANGATEVRLTYRIRDNDLQSVDGNPKRGHIQGPRTYLYVVGHKLDPTLLHLTFATGTMPVATSLDPAGAASPGEFDRGGRRIGYELHGAELRRAGRWAYRVRRFR